MSAGARPAAAGPLAASWRTLVSDYFEMTKPKVQSLLLFTTVTTMYVAGDPSLGLVALTCLGGALSAGGAGAINHALDRDLDRAMRRTADRPVASGRVSPAAAIVFGVLLGCASFALLALAVNPLAAVLSMSGLLGYVLVYTMWLKRTTPQNIVIGGAAGAVQILKACAEVARHPRGTDRRLVVDPRHYDGPGTGRVVAPAPPLVSVLMPHLHRAPRSARSRRPAARDRREPSPAGRCAGPPR